MTIKARRSGKTASYWDDAAAPYDEKLTSYPTPDEISFWFSMPSKGGGVTNVGLYVTSESFEDVAKAMIVTNREATIRAFAAAILAEPEAETEDDSE
jgi:hypothetical protein